MKENPDIYIYKREKNKKIYIIYKAEKKEDISIIE